MSKPLQGAGLPLIIREGRPDDRARVTEIGFAAMRTFGINPDPEQIDRDLATFGDRAPHKLIELVAETSAGIIGSILASTEDSDAAKITGFYVAENARGGGVGALLLGAAIEACKRQAIARIKLTTHANMHAAIRLYEKAGFRPASVETQDGHDYIHFHLDIIPPAS